MDSELGLSLETGNRRTAFLRSQTAVTYLFLGERAVEPLEVAQSGWLWLAVLRGLNHTATLRKLFLVNGKKLYPGALPLISGPQADSFHRGGVLVLGTGAMGMVTVQCAMQL
jgi:hypothetical protein